MKRMQSIIVFIIIFLIFQSAYSSFSLENPEKKEWLLMFYVATDNKMYPNAKNYVEKLTAAYSDKLNMIVFIDGNGDNDTSLYYVGKNGLVDLGWEEPEANSGSPATLEKFCKFCIENYPAEHLSLIIISVGPGWQGVCPDYRNGYRNFPLISIPSLATVLKNITQNGHKKLEIVSIVACLQAMIEIAYELSPYAKYLVAMETDNAFLQIWPDIEVIKRINRSCEDFVRNIVQSFQPRVYHPTDLLIAKFFDSLPFKKLNIVTINTTLSAINLSRIEKIVNEIDELSPLLIEDKNAVKIAREKSLEYGKWSPKYKIFYPIYDYLSLEIYAYDCNIDLYNFLNLLKHESQSEKVKNLCIQIMNDLNTTVLERKTVPSDKSMGLSIYFPEEKFLYNQFILLGDIPYPYEELSFSKNTKWDEFLKSYLGITDAIIRGGGGEGEA